ncbi:GNAT family N-acetyltransferase [Lactococcus nasutitermitis]|uniref:GNAT family N-acetyltransferase n=1 Tax=Lactococcus nasutitermitis TaxID=1652957 RepID=A0ABV9JGK2_9LACT|nr:GNAT family N-acetyltransferase [Lactococcus nasutitermitis]
MQNVRFSGDLTEVKWHEVAELLHYYGLTKLSEEKIKESFFNSYRCVFAFDEDEKLIGVVRAVSDGVAHAEIYNLALAESYHHQGIGERLFKSLVEQLEGMIVTLYTHPKTVDWYKNLGMSQLNTALVLFLPEEKEWMLQEKFIDE